MIFLIIDRQSLRFHRVKIDVDFWLLSYFDTVQYYYMCTFILNGLRHCAMLVRGYRCIYLVYYGYDIVL